MKVHKKTCVWIFIALSIDKNRTQPKCQSTEQLWFVCTMEHYSKIQKSWDTDTDRTQGSHWHFVSKGAEGVHALRLHACEVLE